MRDPMASRGALALLLFTTRICLALDWWIDQSCEIKLGSGTTRKMLEQAVDTAKASKTRLDADDPNMLNLFSQLMSFDFDYPEEDAAEKTFFNRKRSRALQLFGKLISRSQGFSATVLTE